MSVHESWLASMQRYREELLNKKGVRLTLPPPSLQELGLEYLEVSPGKKILARVPFQSKFTNPIGLYQGGFLAAALDEVFGPLSYITAQGPCMTLAMNVSYLKAFTQKQGFCLIEAEVLKKTSTLIFMRADVKTPEGDLMAHAETHVSILREDQLRGLKP